LISSGAVSKNNASIQGTLTHPHEVISPLPSSRLTSHDCPSAHEKPPPHVPSHDPGGAQKQPSRRIVPLVARRSFSA